MKDKDNILVEHFLQKEKREIADKGFTHKVMLNLPRKSYEKELFRLNLLWNTTCFILFALLFYFLDGWDRFVVAFANQLQMMKYTLLEEWPSALEHLLYSILSGLQDAQTLQYWLSRVFVYIVTISALCIYRVYRTEE